MNDISASAYYAVVPDEVLYSPDISADAVRVYAIGSILADKQDGIYHLGQVAELAGMTLDAVVTAFEELEDSGLIG